MNAVAKTLPVIRGPLPAPEECLKCPLAVDGTPRLPVRGVGHADAKFIIVGEGPGRTEQIKGVPFVGQSGKLLERALQTVGSSRNQAFVMNTTLCLPKPSPSKEKDVAEAAKHCRNRFLQELAMFPSLPILALGAHAAKAFLGDKFKITELAGSYHEVPVSTMVPVGTTRASLRATPAHHVRANVTAIPVPPVRATASTTPIFQARASRCATSMSRTRASARVTPDAHTRAKESTAPTSSTRAIEVATSGSHTRIIIPTIHPAAILRGSGGEGSGGAHAQDLIFWNLIYDCAKITRLAAGKQVVFTDDIFTEHQNGKRAEQLIERICRLARRAGSVAIDTETVGTEKENCHECFDCKGHDALDARHANLKAIGLATEALAVSVRWGILSSRGRSMIQSLLSDQKVGKLFHNACYDVPVLRRHGMPVLGPVDDSLYLHHNAFPGLAHKLQRVATQFFCIRPWKAEFHRGEGEPKELLEYNSRDALATARLKPQLEVCVKRTAAERTYAMDMKKCAMAVKMQEWGIPVDLTVNRELAERFRPIIEKAKNDLSTRILDTQARELFFQALTLEQAKRARKDDPADFLSRQAIRREEVDEDFDDLNLRSTDQVVAFLKACGVSLTQVTKKGKLTTKREVLEQIDHPAVRDLLVYREYDHDGRVHVFPIPYLVDKHCRMHPEWFPNKITGRFGSSPNCFEGSTEILTSIGWQRFDALVRGVPVAQFEPATNRITWTVPTDYIVTNFIGDLVALRNSRIDLLTTPDHRLLVQRRDMAWEDVLASDIVWDRKVFHGGDGAEALGTWLPTQAWITLICAAQADGHWTGSGWTWNFCRARKITRLVAALTTLAAPFSVVERTFESQFTSGPTPRTRVYLRASKFATMLHETLGDTKAFGPWVLTLAPYAASRVLDEIMLWDGSFTRRDCYSSSVRQNVDWLQVLAVLSGRAAKIRAYTGSKIAKVVNWQLDFKTNPYSWTTNVEQSSVKHAGPVYCVSVPSSYIVVRRNGKPVIVGNCQNWTQGFTAEKTFEAWRRTFDRDGFAVAKSPNLRWQVVAPKGRIFCGADAQQLEARVVALLSGDEYLLRTFREGIDIHAEFAKDVFGDLFHGKDHCTQCKHLRDITKNIEYGFLYGAAEATAWKQATKEGFHIPLRQVFHAFTVFRKKLVGVEKWHASLFRQVLEKWEIRSFLYGRRRAFPLLHAEPTVVRNFIVQASAADIMDTALDQLSHKLGPRDLFLIHGHDSFTIETDEDRAEKVKDMLVESMTQHFEVNGVAMDFPVEAKIGQTWAAV